jgi:hypothetical protein
VQSASRPQLLTIAASIQETREQERGAGCRLPCSSYSPSSRKHTQYGCATSCCTPTVVRCTEHRHPRLDPHTKDAPPHMHMQPRLTHIWLINTITSSTAHCCPYLSAPLLLQHQIGTAPVHPQPGHHNSLAPGPSAPCPVTDLHQPAAGCRGAAGVPSSLCHIPDLHSGTTWAAAPAAAGASAVAAEAVMLLKCRGRLVCTAGRSPCGSYTQGNNVMRQVHYCGKSVVVLAGHSWCCIATLNCRRCRPKPRPSLSQKAVHRHGQPALCQVGRFACAHLQTMRYFEAPRAKSSCCDIQ